MEYIEREAAIGSLLGWAEQLTETYGKNDEYVKCLESAAYNIEQIPAADVRPVVTCGECKHWFENGSDYCSCDRDALLRERDFFCAAGEKREES